VTSKSSGAVGLSTGSIDGSVSSEIRDSPMLTHRVEVHNPGQIPIPANKRQSLPEYDWSSKLVLKLNY